MNITLKTFQKTRVRELRETAAVAQMGWQHFNKLSRSQLQQVLVKQS